MLTEKFIVIKGAGDIATAVAHKLYRSGFKLMMTEISRPTCVRRNVSFANAVLEGEWTVEGITARKALDLQEALKIIEENKLPVLVDSEAMVLKEIDCIAVVDCIIAKRNTGTKRGDAPIVIALGPGFVAGEDVDVVIETNRGHNLGRIITEGPASADTKEPGYIQGYSAERILRSPANGIIINVKEIGDYVELEEAIAIIDGEVARAQVSGVIRGLISNGIEVSKGLKIGDIDPRGQDAFVDTISDKGRCIAGAVLEVIVSQLNR